MESVLYKDTVWQRFGRPSVIQVEYFEWSFEIKKQLHDEFSFGTQEKHTYVQMFIFVLHTGFKRITLNESN